LRYEVVHDELRPRSGSRTWTDALDDYSKARATWLVCLHAPELYVSAGAIPVILSAADATPLVIRWWNWWSQYVCKPVLERSLAAPPVHAREQGMVMIWSHITALAVDPEEAIAGVRTGVRMAGRSDELQRVAAAGHDSERQFLAAEYFAAGPGRAKLYLGSDGRFRTGWGRIRDVHGRPHQKTMVGVTDQIGAEESVKNERLGSRGRRVVKECPISDVRQQGDDEHDALIAVDVLHQLRVAGEVVEAAASAEAYEAVEVFVAESLTQSPTPTERLLLGHAWDLFNETTTPTEIANQSGHSDSTARAAWRRILGRMATHPRLQAVLRSA